MTRRLLMGAISNTANDGVERTSPTKAAMSTNGKSSERESLGRKLCRSFACNVVMINNPSRHEWVCDQSYLPLSQRTWINISARGFAD